MCYTGNGLKNIAIISCRSQHDKKFYNIGPRSSGESLSGGCGSKSPSPSRLSDHGASLASMDSFSKINPPEKGYFRKESGPDLVPRKRRVSGPASTRKSSLEPSVMNKSEDGFLDAGKSFDEARDQLEDSFFPTCGRPPGGKRISCREDSVESSGGIFCITSVAIL